MNVIALAAVLVLLTDFGVELLILATETVGGVTRLAIGLVILVATMVWSSGLAGAGRFGKESRLTRIGRSLVSASPAFLVGAAYVRVGGSEGMMCAAAGLIIGSVLALVCYLRLTGASGALPGVEPINGRPRAVRTFGGLALLCLALTAIKPVPIGQALGPLLTFLLLIACIVMVWARQEPSVDRE